MSYRSRSIFISHAWKYSDQYDRIVQWLDECPDFYWRNCSVPYYNSFDDCSEKELEDAMTRQIRPAQIVLILSGMYVSYSDWIEYEMDEAYRMGKSIVGIMPRGQQKTPRIVNDYAHEIVRWNQYSIIDAIRRNS